MKLFKRFLSKKNKMKSLSEKHTHCPNLARIGGKVVEVKSKEHYSELLEAEKKKQVEQAHLKQLVVQKEDESVIPQLLSFIFEGNNADWETVLLLPKVYYRQKRYDECWKTLNRIQCELKESSEHLCDIREFQAKISRVEKRPLDALQQKMSSLLLKRTPPSDKLEQRFGAYIKRAGLLDRSEEIYELYRKHVHELDFDEKTGSWFRPSGSFNEACFVKEYKAMIT